MVSRSSDSGLRLRSEFRQQAQRHLVAKVGQWANRGSQVRQVGPGLRLAVQLTEPFFLAEAVELGRMTEAACWLDEYRTGLDPGQERAPAQLLPREGGGNSWRFTEAVSGGRGGVAGNQGANTPGVDGLTAANVAKNVKQVMHGWASYFRHAVAKSVFDMLDNFAWWRVIRMLQTRHRWKRADVRRRFTAPSGR